MISFVDGYFGWLGNQMFQYAATYALSLRSGTTCAFPENTPNLHEVFNLSAKTKSNPSPIYFEESFSYSSLPIPHEDMKLYGYFQSEKYFADFADEVRKEFTFKKKVEALSTNTVSVHVRRGDYLNLSDHHPVCSLDYYKRAMNEFPKDCRFLIFSDDKQWCQDNFTKESCEVSLNTDPLEDLQLMSLCDHHIMANSSFSWWGAWLGGNKGKKVVAPKKWFGPAKKGYNTKDVYCKEWLVI
jgi:hypothetical protein